MQITFIGTGSGETSLKRNHSSLLFDVDLTRVIIDCGDGISKALLSNKIDYNSITHIIFSHYHADHFAGIASLITQMKLNARASKLTILTHQNLVDELKNILHSTYIFESALDFELKIIGFLHDNEINIEKDFSFIAKINSHIYNKHNVNIIENSKFISSSFLFKCNNKNIIYTSDIGDEDDLYLFNKIELDLFITETTHISLEQIEKFVKTKLPRKVLLTHISDSDEENINSWYKKLSKELKEKIEIAEDSKAVQIN